jgi:predicted enzyme related to lactoylglutathione lyase
LLNLLVLRCRDTDAARAFYECFGMTFTKHAHGGGPEHSAHEDERGVFELYPAAADAPPDRTRLGFAVEDLDGAAWRLGKAGFAPAPAADLPWGRTFVVRDPDGRRVEVKQVKQKA